jgi:hypothetical protein
MEQVPAQRIRQYRRSKVKASGVDAEAENDGGGGADGASPDSLRLCLM